MTVCCSCGSRSANGKVKLQRFAYLMLLSKVSPIVFYMVELYSGSRRRRIDSRGQEEQAGTESRAACMLCGPWRSELLNIHIYISYDVRAMSVLGAFWAIIMVLYSSNSIFANCVNIVGNNFNVTHRHSERRGTKCCVESQKQQRPRV